MYGSVEAEIVFGLLERVTLEEVQETIKHMKLGKAAGISGVAVVHILASGTIGVEVLTEICNRVLDGKGMRASFPNSLSHRMPKAIPGFSK